MKCISCTSSTAGCLWAHGEHFSHWSTVWCLTHWGRVTHICVSKITIIGSDNGLSLDRRQAIIWTNAGILLIGPLGTKFREILIEMLTFSFKKMRLKVLSARRWPFCLALNVLKVHLGHNGLKVQLYGVNAQLMPQRIKKFRNFLFIECIFSINFTAWSDFCCTEQYRYRNIFWPSDKLIPVFTIISSLVLSSIDIIRLCRFARPATVNFSMSRQATSL